ncbi:hypothetical protein AMTRI_Chr12g273350 [Amborella trichopoda]
MVLMETLAPMELCPMEWSTPVNCAPWDVVLIDWCKISSNGMEHSSEMCPVPHRMVLMETLAPMELVPHGMEHSCAPCPIADGSDGLVRFSSRL